MEKKYKKKNIVKLPNNKIYVYYIYYDEEGFPYDPDYYFDEHNDIMLNVGF